MTSSSRRLLPPAPLLASCFRRQPCSRLAPAGIFRARTCFSRWTPAPTLNVLASCSSRQSCSPLAPAGRRARLFLPSTSVQTLAPHSQPAALSSSLSTSSHRHKDCLIAASSVISVYVSGMDETNLAVARQMKVYVENLVMGVTVEVHTSQCCRFKIQGQDGVTFMDAEDTVDLRDDHLLRDVANQIADHFVNTRSGLIRRRSKSIVIEIWSSAPEGVREKAADIKKALDKCRVAIRLQVRIEHSALRESFSVRDEDGNHFLQYTQYVPPDVMCHFIDVKDVVGSIVTAADNDQH